MLTKFKQYVSIIFNRKQNETKIISRGGFSINVGNGSYVMGNYWVNEDITDDEFGYIIIEHVVKICKERNVSFKNSLQQVKSNLKQNGL